MLVNLHVKNMALIEEADIDFTNGLNILTGETGAGKSIIIGSVSAALGERVSPDIIRKGADYALAEVTFHIEDYDRLMQLKAMDILNLEDKDIIISRKIMPSRSTIKVNGETVTSARVREIAALLIDIHGQHEHQSLLNENRQLELIDRFLGDSSKAVREALALEYDNYRNLKRKFEEFDIDEGQRIRDTELIRHELEEIGGAGLTIGEDSELESTFRRMNNSQKIMSELAQVNEMLNEGGQDTASALIGRSIRSMSQASALDEAVLPLGNMLNEISGLINDFNRELSTYMDRLEFNEDEYNEVSRRLDLINSLKMKYGGTIEDILAYYDRQRRRLDDFENFDINKQALEKSLDESVNKLNALCDELTRLRKSVAEKLAEDVAESLGELNFLDGRFEVEFNKKESFSPCGNDSVCFMISTNPGEDLKPLSRVASGGEMSRIMLALKAVLADKDDIDSLIFDEIDSGISGRTAQKVAEKMNAISGSRQIICITHLPQIASMADTHFVIEKNVIDGGTVTTIHKLNKEDSIREIARLLGGSSITEAVLANARELKESSGKF